MIKNNNGVTLVELLIVIVVMGIIAAFSIPAVGTIIENTNKDAILNDAIQIEQASKTYCNTRSDCDQGTTTLTWAQLKPYVSGIEDNTATAPYYLLDPAGTAVVSTWTTSGWTVHLEAVAVEDSAATDGEWEFPTNLVPSDSASDREDLVRDTN